MKKKNLTFIILLALTSLLSAKNDFKVIQSMSLPFSPSEMKYEHTSDFNYFLCSTKTDMLMVDGIGTKILW